MRLIFIAFICLLLHCFLDSCTTSETKSDSTNEILYSLGFVPDCDANVPEESLPLYGECTVEYPYLAEKGLPFDSIYFARYPYIHLSEKQRIYPKGSGKNSPIVEMAVEYLEKNNKQLWYNYLYREDNMDDLQYPIISVYWVGTYYCNYMISLVCYYFKGTDRVIYGRHVPVQMFYDALNTDIKRF